MKANSRIARSILAIAFTAAAARAGETPIDISSVVNEPWTYVAPNGDTVHNGSTFPIGSQNFGGVPFVIPTGPNNYWEASAAANFGPGTVSLTIPVGVYGVTSAFTLLGTFWGSPGPNAYLYVTFTGSNGATLTQPLVGGVGVRDYNNGSYTDTINNTSPPRSGLTERVSALTVRNTSCQRPSPARC